MKLLERINIRTRIYFVSGMASVLLIVFGIASLGFMRTLSVNQENYQTAIALNKHINTIAFTLRTEHYTISNLSNAETLIQLNEHWNKHLHANTVLQQNIETILQLVSKTTNNEFTYSTLNEQRFKLKINNFNNTYTESVLPVFMQLYNTQWNEISYKNGSNTSNTETTHLIAGIEGDSQEENTTGSTQKSLIRYLQTATDEIDSITIQTDNLIKEVLKSMDEKKFRLMIFIWLLILIFIVIMGVVSMLVVYSLRNQLYPVVNSIRQLTNGNIPEKLSIETKGVINEISENLNNLTDSLKNTIVIIKNVGNEIFDIDIDVFEKQSQIHSALTDMQQSLHKVTSEREKANQKQQQTNWTNTGIAEFSQILKNPGNDIKLLSYKLLYKLIQYVNAAVGGFYLLKKEENEQPVINLISCAAYNRKRILKTSFAIGEGLIGRCAEEKQKIYMTDIPDDYLQIKSGLGHEVPQNLLIVPMMYNNEVYGVLEIASFHQFEAHEISFIEKISENITGTIRFINNNIETQKLLEKTKLQAEELTSQEEELRQNMEEMLATQEEAERKERLSIGFSNTVNHTLIRADFDTFGRFKYGNSLFLDTLGYKSKEIAGMDISMFLIEEEVERIAIIINNIAKGGKHFEGELIFKTKKSTVKLMTTLTAVRNDDGGVEQILLLALNVDGFTN